MKNKDRKLSLPLEVRRIASELRKRFGGAEMRFFGHSAVSLIMKSKTKQNGFNLPAFKNAEELEKHVKQQAFFKKFQEYESNTLLFYIPLESLKISDSQVIHINEFEYQVTGCSTNKTVILHTVSPRHTFKVNRGNLILFFEQDDCSEHAEINLHPELQRQLARGILLPNTGIQLSEILKSKRLSVFDFCEQIVLQGFSAPSEVMNEMRKITFSNDCFETYKDSLAEKYHAAVQRNGTDYTRHLLDYASMRQISAYYPTWLKAQESPKPLSISMAHPVSEAVSNHVDSARPTFNFASLDGFTFENNRSDFFTKTISIESPGLTEPKTDVIKTPVLQDISVAANTEINPGETEPMKMDVVLTEDAGSAVQYSNQSEVIKPKDPMRKKVDFEDFFDPMNGWEETEITPDYFSDADEDSTLPLKFLSVPVSSNQIIPESNVSIYGEIEIPTDNNNYFNPFTEQNGQLEVQTAHNHKPSENTDKPQAKIASIQKSNRKRAHEVAFPAEPILGTGERIDIDLESQSQYAETHTVHPSGRTRQQSDPKAQNNLLEISEQCLQVTRKKTRPGKRRKPENNEVQETLEVMPGIEPKKKAARKISKDSSAPKPVKERKKQRIDTASLVVEEPAPIVDDNQLFELRQNFYFFVNQLNEHSDQSPTSAGYMKKVMNNLPDCKNQSEQVAYIMRINQFVRLDYAYYKEAIGAVRHQDNKFRLLMLLGFSGKSVKDIVKQINNGSKLSHYDCRSYRMDFMCMLYNHIEQIMPELREHDRKTLRKILEKHAGKISLPLPELNPVNHLFLPIEIDRGHIPQMRAINQPPCILEINTRQNLFFSPPQQNNYIGPFNQNLSQPIRAIHPVLPPPVQLRTPDRNSQAPEVNLPQTSVQSRHSLFGEYNNTSAPSSYFSEEDIGDILNDFNFDPE